jgi:hypothetical protein
VKNQIIFSDNIVKTQDDKCIVGNKFPENINNRNSIKGFVEIVDKETGKLLDKQNLIVYDGRETILQRALNFDRVTGSNEKDLYVSWLSVGTGGALTTDPLNPIAPNINDSGLSNQIVIDPNNTTYADGGRKKNFDSIEILMDDSNDNRYLIAKLTTTILRDEANVYDLNEAALWLSNSHLAANATTFKLFSRVTFSTVRKDQNREIVLIWYLFF